MTVTSPTAPPALLTIDELSAYLQIPKATIYGWRHKGEGPRALKLGGQLRWRQVDVDAWLAAA